MRYHSLCGGSQYQTALSFLDAHRGHVAMVTSGGIDYTCVSRVLAVTKKDLSAMLAGIRKDVGTATPITGMNYYDPFLGNWLSGPAGQAATQTSVQALVVLNAFLTGIYTAVGDPVANVQDAFHSTDLTTIVASKWGTVPLASRVMVSARDRVDIGDNAGRAGMMHACLIRLTSHRNSS